jgi:hypothetical protein
VPNGSTSSVGVHDPTDRGPALRLLGVELVRTGSRSATDAHPGPLRLMQGVGYADHGLVFPQEDGTPLPPPSITQTFRRAVRELDVPVAPARCRARVGNLAATGGRAGRGRERAPRSCVASGHHDDLRARPARDAEECSGHVRRSARRGRSMIGCYGYPVGIPLNRRPGGRLPVPPGLRPAVMRRTPDGIRTRVTTLKGWDPRPLDDGSLVRGRQASARSP